MEKIKIIYEDKYLIVVDKPSKFLTIASTKEKEKTIYHLTSLYVKKMHKSNKIFVVHRLDYETSGLIIFAKSIKVKEELQKNWNDVERKYYAVVYGLLPKIEDEIKVYLKESKTYQVFVTNNKKYGKEAITKYKVININNKYSLLDINLLTGRKNQIRVSLNYLNNPIVGDKLYNKEHEKRLCLDAYYLSFIHPVIKKRIVLEKEYPIYFSKYIGKKDEDRNG